MPDPTDTRTPTTQAREASSFTRLPELDGLRGIAVLAVMSNHFLWWAELMGMFRMPAGGAWYWLVQLQYCGWLGVDLFFALSGFLITGILADNREQPHHFRNFYLRRSLRIFPVYYLAVLVLWPLAKGYYQPGMQGADEPYYPAWLATYTTNVLITVHGWIGLPTPLRHLWSLAVEEQFYLFWPLAIFFLDRRKAIALCTVLMLCSPLLRIAMAQLFPARTADYVLLPSRMDSLAAGSLMALLWRQGCNITALLRWARVVAVITFLMIVTMYIVHRGLPNTDSFDRSWGLSIFAAFFACLVMLSATEHGPAVLRQLLRHRTLRWFGQYSYGLYLFHEPVCLLLYSTRLMPVLAHAYAPHSMALLVILLYAAPLITSVALAYASWHLWEQPFLRLKDRFTMKHLPQQASGSARTACRKAHRDPPAGMRLG